MVVGNYRWSVPSPGRLDDDACGNLYTCSGGDVGKIVCQRLFDSGLDVFFDDPKIEFGKEIMPNILQAIWHMVVACVLGGLSEQFLFISSISLLFPLAKKVVSLVRRWWNSFGPQEGPGGDEGSPVRPLNEEDRPDGDDEKVSEERTSQSDDDWHSCLSTSVEDEKSDNKDGVGSALSANISEPVHNVSRRRITLWKKGKVLGRGAYGTVYEGISDDGFIFAIKEVSSIDSGSRDEERLLRLKQEISLLSQFDHENIVRYLGSEKDDKNLYIFLELMTNGSLVTLYCKDELRDSQVSKFTRQILNGLKYLHDRTVVHRDIKCANILVDASGSVKLADFGLAKATEMNAAKTPIGSAFWMAPEVVNPNLRSSQSNGSYGLEVDIWSLGCTVLEMLTRQHPYPELDGPQAHYQIGKGKPPPIPDSLSRDAQDLILRCLQVNPNDRPSAAQLLDHPFVRKPPTSSGFASPRFNNRCS